MTNCSLYVLKRTEKNNNNTRKHRKECGKTNERATHKSSEELYVEWITTPINDKNDKIIKLNL